MCGIIGASWNDSEGVSLAASLFAYRGPDFFGSYSDDRVSLGHHRLAIVDLDIRSHQPMSDPEQKIHLVFNGEIYNYREVRQALEVKYSFRTTSDTEVILYAYAEYGEDLCRYLKGMFAFAIYDTVRSRILVFRDHVGIKPVYYFFQNDQFAFASELKGLVHLARRAGIKTEVKLEALELFGCFGYIPSPHTVLQGFYKLLPGKRLEFDLNSRRLWIESYATDSVACSTPQDLKVVIEKKILQHAHADVPVGVFFSGGTDSSLIASVLHAHGKDLATYSVRMFNKSEDAEYFDKINQYLGLKCRVFDFEPKDFSSVYEEVASRIDEPLSDSSIFPTTFLSKIASRDVKVVLSGEGGDEFFYGYQRDVILNRMRSVRLRSPVMDSVYLRFPASVKKDALFRKLYARLGDAAGYYLLEMSPYRDLLFPSVWSRGRSLIEGIDVKPVQLDQVLYLENDLLRKIDLATSYASIEGRVPLLDVDILRGASAFSGMHLRNGVLKSFLKEFLCDYLPKELVYRGKSGFGLGTDRFYEQSSLLQDAQKGLTILFDGGVLKCKVDQDLIKKYPHARVGAALLFRSLQNLGVSS